MANVIRIKRRATGNVGAPSSLKNAELAFNEVDDVLYYGKGDDGSGNATSVVAIGGNGGYVAKSGDQTIAGTKTFTGSVDLTQAVATATTQLSTDDSTKLATTAFVKAAITSSSGNETITLSGDATGSGATSITVTLADSGVTAGTYTKLTVDSKGRATAGASLDATDIPTITAAKISDFDTQVRTNRLDQLSAPTSAVSFNSQKITSLADPTSPQDAATKAYVDASRAGLAVKDAARAATTANITLSGEQTIDGVSLVAGDRVLVKNQSTASQNGVYVVAAGPWTRATDVDTPEEISAGLFIFVQEGTLYANTGWTLTTTGTITIGSTSLTFAQFSGAGSIEAGDGLTRIGSTIAVGTASTSRIVVNSNDIDLATTGVTAGDYFKVTVDAYGRVTAASNPTTLSGFGITDAQPLDATLTALAAVTTGANKLIYADGSDSFTTTDFTTFGRSLVGGADATAGRSTLGLGTIATQAANNVSISGGSITNLTTFDGITVDGGSF